MKPNRPNHSFVPTALLLPGLHLMLASPITVIPSPVQPAVSLKGAQVDPSSRSTTPIDVTLSLDGDGTVMQGEPLVLRALISDVASVETKVHYAFREDDWLHISLEDDKGKQSVPVLDTLNYPYVPYSFGGLGARVDPNRMQSQVRVLRPEWLGDPPPGNYRLRVLVQLPYSRGSDDKAMSDGTSLVFRKEIVIPLKIAKVKLSTLRAKAAAMRETILDKSSGGPARDLAAEILYAIPDEYAQVEREGMLRDRRSDEQIQAFAYVQVSRLQRLNRPDVVAERRRKLLEFRKNAADSSVP